MATLKRRLHRNNGSGYDTVHFETEAKLVLMSDGTTAEDAINWRMPRGIIGQIDVTTNLFTLQHGIYFAQGDVAKSNNWPIDGAFMGLVIKQGTGDGTGGYYHCVITAYNENTCLVYRNIYRYSAWSGWQVDYNSQCMPTLAELSTADGNKIGKLYCTIDDGVYVRAIEGAKEEECGVGNGDLFLNYRRPNNTIYMGGNGSSSNVAIHSGNIGNYAATTSSLNALATRVSNLEGSVDMAKLVHTESLSFRRNEKTITTYTNADYVIVKPVTRSESNLNRSDSIILSDDSAYKIMKGCSALCALYCNSNKCIESVVITYNSDGTLTHNVYDDHNTTSYSGTLEFYKQ